MEGTEKGLVKGLRNEGEIQLKTVGGWLICLRMICLETGGQQLSRTMGILKDGIAKEGWRMGHGVVVSGLALYWREKGVCFAILVNQIRRRR